MSSNMMQQISRSVLRHCREHGLAALESGISWPVPTMNDGRVQLVYLLYWSQLQGRQQIIHEPFARVTAAYPEGTVVAHHPLQVASPPRELGHFPYPTISRFSPEERRAIWNELLDAYPGAIAAYAGWPASSTDEELCRFAEIQTLSIPPYLRETYHALNPHFFEWLGKVTKDKKIS